MAAGRRGKVLMMEQNTALANKSLRIGVFGAPGVGKTTFIQSICSTKNAAAEIYEYRNQVFDDAYRSKNENKTPPVLDFAKIQEGDTTLYLFENHSSMMIDYEWFTEKPSLVEALDGMVVLVDSARDMPNNIVNAEWYLREIWPQKVIPYVIAANFQDLPKAFSPEDMRSILHFDPEIIFLPCVAHNKGSASFVLWNLLTILPESAERNVFAEKIEMDVPIWTLNWLSYLETRKNK